MNILEQTRAAKMTRDLEHVSNEWGLGELDCSAWRYLGAARTGSSLQDGQFWGTTWLGGMCNQYWPGTRTPAVSSLQPRGLFFTYHSSHTIQKCKSLAFYQIQVLITLRSSEFQELPFLFWSKGQYINLLDVLVCFSEVFGLAEMFSHIMWYFSPHC